MHLRKQIGRQGIFPPFHVFPGRQLSHARHEGYIAFINIKIQNIGRADPVAAVLIGKYNRLHNLIIPIHGRAQTVAEPLWINRLGQIAVNTDFHGLIQILRVGGNNQNQCVFVAFQNMFGASKTAHAGHLHIDAGNVKHNARTDQAFTVGKFKNIIHLLFFAHKISDKQNHLRPHGLVIIRNGNVQKNRSFHICVKYLHYMCKKITHNIDKNHSISYYNYIRRASRCLQKCI